MLGIHPIQRKLAEVTFMNTDKCGNTTIGQTELMLIMRLLRENMAIVSQYDLLKELSYMAYEMKDHDWHQDICKKIEELEERVL